MDTVSRDVAIHPNPIATAAAVNKASLPTIAAAVSNSAGYVYFLSLLIVDLNMLHLLLLFLSLLCCTPQERNAAASLVTNHDDTNIPIIAAVRKPYFMFPF